LRPKAAFVESAAARRHPHSAKAGIIRVRFMLLQDAVLLPA
jgi:hypothetical protein